MSVTSTSFRKVAIKLSGGSVTIANPFESIYVADGSHQNQALLSLQDGSFVQTSAIFDIVNGPNSEVPEPSWMLQFSSGVALLAWLSTRRRRKRGAVGRNLP